MFPEYVVIINSIIGGNVISILQQHLTHFACLQG